MKLLITKISANVSLLCSAILSFIIMSLGNPFDNSLSSIGRRFYALYIVWSIMTGIAIFLNLLRLHKRTRFKLKYDLWLIILGVLSFIVNVFSLYYFEDDFYFTIHLFSGFGAAAFIGTSILLCTLYGGCVKKGYLIMGIITLLTLLADFMWIIMIDFTAVLLEIIPILAFYLIFIVTDNIPYFKVKLTPSIIGWIKEFKRL